MFETAELGRKIDKQTYGSAVPELARSILDLPAVHLLALAKARSKGIDVDEPRHLSYHVSL